MHNVIQQKYAARNWLRNHKRAVAKMNMKSKWWGPAARRNAWRVTKAATGKGSTRRAAVEAVLWPDTLAEKVVKVALAEVGVTESPYGSNRGPRVDAYTAVTGTKAQPWCAAFVCWVYRKAGFKGEFAPLAAYVPSWTTMIRNGTRGWREVSFSNARPGDVVTLWGSGHIEIVRKREGDYLLTIGGNTSPVGKNANGGGVFKVKRHRSEVTAIGRPK